eukprot:m.699379 g.699379  ORF g.699379 m.699379 type:complete len:744 (+) comp22904_c0_seq4:265-2496(+)
MEGPPHQRAMTMDPTAATAKSDISAVGGVHGMRASFESNTVVPANEAAGSDAQSDAADTASARDTISSRVNAASVELNQLGAVVESLTEKLRQLAQRMITVAQRVSSSSAEGTRSAEPTAEQATDASATTGAAKKVAALESTMASKRSKYLRRAKRSHNANEWKEMSKYANMLWSGPAPKKKSSSLDDLLLHIKALHISENKLRRMRKGDRPVRLPVMVAWYLRRVRVDDMMRRRRSRRANRHHQRRHKPAQPRVISLEPLTLDVSSVGDSLVVGWDELSDTSELIGARLWARWEEPEDVNDEHLLKLQHITSILENPELADVVRLENVVQVRKKLSIEDGPPIDQALSAGLLPLLTRSLASDVGERILYEAAWAITNICSGNTHHVAAVVAAGLIPRFIELLLSENVEIANQAAWALGNISGDSSEHRDKVLEFEILDVFQRRMMEFKSNLAGQVSLSFVRQLAWVSSNLMRGKPKPQYAHMDAASKWFGEYLTIDDDEVVADACWAISYICDGPDDVICLISRQRSMVEKLISLLSSDNRAVVVPALRACGNIGAGDDSQTQLLVDLGVCDKIKALLDTPNLKTSTMKEAMWLISNITATTPPMIQKVVDAGLDENMLTQAMYGEKAVRKEAIWALCNYAQGCSLEQMMELIDYENEEMSFYEALFYSLEGDRQQAMGDLNNVILEGILAAVAKHDDAKRPMFAFLEVNGPQRLQETKEEVVYNDRDNELLEEIIERCQRV